ncbi:BCCT family transporter [Thalassotalea ponticola]|uniref:BCCT family transporter n=1 Tax=Thalassotalea ponticola TaxID=1523392 RepID=UPI0025B539A6|nr:BCCT family transporter [Thalassotalea ponticola]MDN3651991.1 BCCT family transporter [Thalassotalea ponticola]
MSNSPAVLNRKVFAPATAMIAILLCFTLVWPDTATQTFQAMQQSITINGGWFYVLTVAILLGVILFLAISRFGDIKLGPDHSTPDYSMTSWISMLFAAGMGIGLMFFGVAEPLMHYLSPPTAEPGSREAIKEAMRITFFHWGFHAWAIYALVALILGYFSYRQGLPLTLRSALHPIIGDRIYGWPGHLVDMFAVVSTVFGTATSLGIGASQVNAGLNYLYQFDINANNQLIIIITITFFASISVATGLDKGIKILSEINMKLAVLLLLLVFSIGPTVFLLQAYLQNIGEYLSTIVSKTFNLFAYDKQDWIGGWTIFYWGWWLAWAPFVGLFIARISKGRTIREFIFGALFVPTLFTLLWMSIFGNSAISMVVNDGISKIGDMVSENSSVALFVFLDQLPWSNVLMVVTIAMIVIFFVTSCDSGAMVVDMLCSNGRNDTPMWQRLFWAILMGSVAGVLSLVGGLEALQTVTIASALPFAFVLLLACYGLAKALRIESAKRYSLKYNLSANNIYSGGDDWQQNLNNILSTPSRNNVDVFINNTVKPALEKVKAQFQLNDIDVTIEPEKGAIVMRVCHGDEYDFIYGVYKKQYTTSESSDAPNSGPQSYFRAEVHLIEGGQDYDIMGWSEQAVINDIVDQYQKHMHFLHLLRE